MVEEKITPHVQIEYHLSKMLNRMSVTRANRPADRCNTCVDTALALPGIFTYTDLVRV